MSRFQRFSAMACLFTALACQGRDAGVARESSREGAGDVGGTRVALRSAGVRDTRVAVRDMSRRARPEAGRPRPEAGRPDTFRGLDRDARYVG